MTLTRFAAASLWLLGVHLLLRKIAHVTEYAVLALLWFKALDRLGGVVAEPGD